MQRYSGVRDHPDIIKDNRSGAILFNNPHEIERAKAKKKIRLQNKERGSYLEEEVSELKQRLDGIEGLLRQIIEKQ
jgi:hypothetical protein